MPKQKKGDISLSKKYLLINRKLAAGELILSPSGIRALSPTNPVLLIFEGIYLRTGRI
jgi:hypothetical protein